MEYNIKKPNGLIITDLKWKFLVRSVIRSKNVLLTGPSGTGKTITVQNIASAMNRPIFTFNLGATQDPRSTLIGNTHYKKEVGTLFAESYFVKAIQTENAIILLDELSRSHNDAVNILMSALDTQRYIRIDEQDTTPIIKVANGVCFIATANIGSEYTTTKTLDRALIDRFSVVEMDVLNTQQEIDLLKLLYPELDINKINTISNISSDIRNEFYSENSKISYCISTRNIIEIADLLADNFSIMECMELCVLPHFDNYGGLESERTFILQIIQKYIAITERPNIKNNNDFFSEDDINKILSA